MLREAETGYALVDILRLIGALLSALVLKCALEFETSIVCWPRCPQLLPILTPGLNFGPSRSLCPPCSPGPGDPRSLRKGEKTLRTEVVGHTPRRLWSTPAPRPFRAASSLPPCSDCRSTSEARFGFLPCWLACSSSSRGEAPARCRWRVLVCLCVCSQSG